jgi:redox-sensitive bicupin YhaK (pirin superfamily)
MHLRFMECCNIYKYYAARTTKINPNMHSTIYKADSRGHANHGWLNTYYSFSFADYYNPDRIRFGALRVLNDDTVQGGMGFDMHPHDNMEIITILLKGALEHKDNR